MSHSLGDMVLRQPRAMAHPELRLSSDATPTNALLAMPGEPSSHSHRYPQQGTSTAPKESDRQISHTGLSESTNVRSKSCSHFRKPNDELWDHLPKETHTRATVAWMQGTTPRNTSCKDGLVVEARPPAARERPSGSLTAHAPICSTGHDFQQPILQTHNKKSKPQL